MIDVLETPWANAIKLEHQVARIIREQMEHGWLLDQDRCKMLVGVLVNKIKEIDEQLLPDIRPRVIRDCEVSGPYRKDGELLARVRDYFEGAANGEFSIRGPFTKVSFESINLGSEKQLKEYLFSIGWEPDEWNIDKETGEKKGPKLTTSSLLKLGKPGELIDQRTVLVHRKNQILGFLRNVREDGRIEARANTIGTNTHRMTHSIVVNVPKAEESVFFGKEMRSVFIVPEDMLMLDYDAKGLEGRMLAHYLNDKSFTDLVLSGDWHNQIWGLIPEYASTRSVSKNVFYALIYGAGDWQLGNTADITPSGMTKTSVGANIRKAIMAGLPSLKALNDKVQKEASLGYIVGLDGRKLMVRNVYSALNLLLQSAGSIVMKVAMCYLDKWIHKESLIAHKIGDFHDEGVLEVFPGHAERLKQLAINCVIQSGNHFKLNCPLDADARIGYRWSEVH